MSSDDYNDFFAAGPADDAAVPAGGSGEEPIILGDAPPAADDQPIFLGDAPPPSADNEPAAYLGEVNEAPPPIVSSDSDPPIVLGPSGEEVGAPPEGEQPAPVVSSGPSPMQKWNEEWQETLMKRKDVENERKAELLEKARADLEAFQRERESKRESKMATNREDEQAKLEAIEADLENDNSWQRVCKMVELSHDSTKQAQDVKRMRDILIYLKNEQSKAEALA